VRGDFLPLVDGGYSLQYSPLLEFREGRGMVLFCQLDVTGRTEVDPAAEAVARNVLRHAADWKPGPRRRPVYAGDAGGLRHLGALGLKPESLQSGALGPDSVLIVGPGGGRTVSAVVGVEDWFKAGGRLLALGLGQEDLDALKIGHVAVRKAEHISTGFSAVGWGSPVAGVGPADVHLREPREVLLVVAGADVVGDGVLATHAGAVFCQVVPWDFEAAGLSNLRRTHRRVAFVVSRLLGNLGVGGGTPLLERFGRPVDPARPEQRWLEGMYLDRPEEWDDPYRFFRW
jgi:hypothetical protein